VGAAKLAGLRRGRLGKELLASDDGCCQSSIELFPLCRTQESPKRRAFAVVGFRAIAERAALLAEPSFGGFTSSHLVPFLAVLIVPSIYYTIIRPSG
jgi:hypothetical protein